LTDNAWDNDTSSFVSGFLQLAVSGLQAQLARGSLTYSTNQLSPTYERSDVGVTVSERNPIMKLSQIVAAVALAATMTTALAAATDEQGRKDTQSATAQKYYENVGGTWKREHGLE